MTSRDPICIFIPPTDWQGDLLVQYLRGEGIDAYLANRHSTACWGNGSLPQAKLEVLVPQAQATEAQKALAEFFAEAGESTMTPDEPSEEGSAESPGPCP